MNRVLALLVLLAGSTLSFGQNKKLDSLYQSLKAHPYQDTNRVKLLYQICYYESTSDNERNKIHASEALEISRRLGYVKGIGYAQKYLAYYYWMGGDYAQAAKHAREMLQTFEPTTNYKAIGQAYALIASIHQDNREFDKAKSYYLKALETHQKAGLKMDIGYDYNGLATLYQVFGKYDEALEYNLKAMNIRKEIDDENGLSQTYNNINLVYKAKKDYAKAIEYAEKSQPILKKLNNKYRLAGNYGNLGAIYTLTGNYAKAEYYLSQSLALAQSLHHKLILAELYQNLADLETKRKNYPKAIGYIKTHQQYQDSIYSEQNARKLAEAETRYETVKKDQTILALEQQKEIQSLQQQYLFIAAGILLIAFAGIYFLQRSYNKKVNRLLQSEKLLTQKLQEDDKLKSRFFANISHEFRTPLSLIMAPIEEKLASASLATTDRESFVLVHRNAARLLTLVNQLLDLSRLEAGRMQLHILQGDIYQLLSVITASFDSLAEKRKIAFNKFIELAPDEYWYDADKVEQIINNLLFNAFKFTSAGGAVTFSASLDATTRQLKLDIIDTGRGIPVEDQQHIFSPFYQSGALPDDGFPGTGLGLSMVNELVKLYGGKIGWQSEPHKGTQFTILLPVFNNQFAPSISRGSTSSVHMPEYTADVYEELNEGEATSENHPDTILVVEDNADLRNFIASSLRRQFTILTAKDGREGVAVAADHIPDLIISDVMMPIMDGIALTEKIKADERTNHVPVILLTAKADLASRLEGLHTGADDYLSKPFSTDELRARVINLIEQRKKLAAKYRAAALQPAPSGEASLDDKFVRRARMVVEANIDNSAFGVEMMADEMSLSRTQLFRKLKAISGLSPNEFINDIRLQRAADLIRAKADTLTQISYSVGYSEQSYFAKRFRKKFGVTPSEYQTTQASD